MSEETKKKTLLDVTELVLIRANRPMNAGELANAIIRIDPHLLSGQTPQKTVTARISMDILRLQEMSRFVRTGPGRFSLRGKGWEVETVVPRRQIAPIEEDILVIPVDDFRRSLGGKLSYGIYQIDRVKILKISKVMRRLEAEESEDFVQLIPTFVIRKTNSVLFHQRTKKLPEARLHNTWSCNFGGHLQSEDSPSLFYDDQNIVDLFYMRELNEELKFSCITTMKFIGALYLSNNTFERQHVGIVFEVSIPDSCTVTSLEPGYHINLTFKSIDTGANEVALDSWSMAIISAMEK